MKKREENFHHHTILQCYPQKRRSLFTSSSLSCEEEASAFLFPLFFPGMFFLACSSNSLLAVALGSKGLVDASPEEGNHTAFIPLCLKTNNTALATNHLPKAKLLLYYVDAVVAEPWLEHKPWVFVPSFQNSSISSIHSPRTELLPAEQSQNRAEHPPP